MASSPVGRRAAVMGFTPRPGLIHREATVTDLPDPSRGPADSTENFPGSDITGDELEFLKAMERYQRRHHRRYPSWREVLRVLLSLGYRKPLPPTV